MKDLKNILKEYAELALRVGLNLQKDQKLFITAPIDGVEFVRIITKKAYELGAKDVEYAWVDDELTHTRFENVDLKTLEIVPKWKISQMDTLVEEKTAFLKILSSDPELLKDIDSKKVATYNKAMVSGLKNYRNKLMSNETQWSLIAIPSEKWAQKVYPNNNKKEAMELLWKSILKASRVEIGNSIKNWEEHNKNLKEKARILNEKKFEKFHYTSKGTDLYVELPEKQVWAAGGSTTIDGILFNPNIPTEEVFSMPRKYGVNGKLSSKMPLNYGGNIIDNFTLIFKEGKVVDFIAEKGYETLKALLDTDEGSRYLGEIALVPVDSPISEGKTLFYNTLFDENASCHFALGAAYKKCIENGDKMSKEELEENQVNDSLIHVDFMVGSEDLSIDGIDIDGNKTPVFRNGKWAI
jgi:aminopeptidase